jgi:hypothetical protein
MIYDGQFRASLHRVSSDLLRLPDDARNQIGAVEKKKEKRKKRKESPDLCRETSIASVRTNADDYRVKCTPRAGQLVRITVAATNRNVNRMSGARNEIIDAAT